MESIDVRSLRGDDEALWLSLDPPESGGDEPENLAAALAREDPCCFLLARCGEECVARLRGRFLNDGLFFIREIRASERVEFADAAGAFAAFLLRSFSEDRTEILAWDRDESRPTNEALETAGFVVGREKVFVEKDIAGYRSPYEDRCAYRTLAEVGEERFIEIMTEASLGDPFEDVTKRDPRRDFRDLIAYAGEKFDPTWWRAAFAGGRPVGIVLPQALSGSVREGSLFYVGVVTDYRGRGLGRILHAGGLEFLADRGITRYVGSTDNRNLPMLTVFAVNGCRQTGTQLFYKPLRRSEERVDAG
jgi:GNAT superfamily N-acetyltransferase